jgi:hypothetical protein
MEDCELVALITAAACAISKCCNENEIAILAASFTQLGDTLATINTQREIRENNAKKENENKQISGANDALLIGTNPNAGI